MRPIALWLQAKPWNGIIGLAFALVVPLLASITSGAVIVMLVLAHGARVALLQGVAAVAIATGLATLLGGSGWPLLSNAVIVCVPGLLLAMLIKRTRSISFTMQVSVIVAVIAIIGIHLLSGDPVALWGGVIDHSIAVLREVGWNEQDVATLANNRELIAQQMTMVSVFVPWSMLALAVVLGYALFQHLPEQQGRFGRFSDLQLGKVLAASMALTSLAAAAVSVASLQDLAFVLFAVFWLQGLAVMHWLHAEGVLPNLAIVALYALLPFLHVLLILGLAVLGYSDAWFNYRQRIAARRARR